ncbi:HEPN domain-containing protein [Stenotrophomonas sp. TWI809]|uniref:HEPN domain-containing protein n=1 Tax=Stenotrophomonas sp. TWI809 TaxID=3136796 RepID=UPI003209172D
MDYARHFQHADEIIEHLTPLVTGAKNPLLEARYTGFLTVAAVTTYELAVKSIFISFAQSKHKVLGAFTESHFNRINGRIKIEAIRNDYVRKFGEKYLKKFNNNLKRTGTLYLQTNQREITSSYDNLITWRNDFAHEGRIRAKSTFAEAARAYNDGKKVIECLADSMRR